MADPKKTAPSDPRAVRDLAAALFAAALPANRAKTPEFLAAESITQARAFFRAWDESEAGRPG